MAFGGFKETNETNENTDNKDSSIENSEKRRNQILEVPEDYDDDFDSKIDKNEDKSEKENVNDEKSEGTEKKGGFDRIKGMFSKDNPDKDKDTEEKNEQNSKPEKSRVETFKDSLKVDQSPEEIEKYNEEHGYSSEITKRPKGGYERERTMEKEDPRREAYEEDDSDNVEQ